MGERENAMLRVLTALAWADGTVTPREAAMLDRAAAEFGLSPEERAQFALLRDEPVPLDRFEELVRELRAVASTSAARREVMEYAHALSAEDGISPEESRWLRVLERILESTETTSSFFARVRAALTPVRSTAEASRAAPREEIERRVLGGLLARRVLQAGGTADGSTLDAGVLRFLRAAGAAVETLGNLGESVRRAAAGDEDRQRLCASVNRITDYEGRVRLLAALFRVPEEGARDRTAVEAELRRIANFLWIEPPEFVRLRAEAAAAATAPPGSPPGDRLAAGGPAA